MEQGIKNRAEFEERLNKNGQFIDIGYIEQKAKEQEAERFYKQEQQLAKEQAEYDAMHAEEQAKLDRLTSKILAEQKAEHARAIKLAEKQAQEEAHARYLKDNNIPTSEEVALEDSLRDMLKSLDLSNLM